MCVFGQNGRVSPRASSQQSDRHSAASQSTSSPRQSSPLTTNMIINESTFQTEKRSPQAVNAESHNAKTARMEAASSQGYGGGIPAKIEEGEEPTEVLLGRE